MTPEQFASRAFCVECGRPVPVKKEDGKWVFSACRNHPQAKRVMGSWYAKQFAKIHAAVDAIKDCPGRVVTGGASYWGVLEARAAKGVGI